MTTSHSNRAHPDPDRVLAEVQAMRPRMKEILGTGWTSFSKILDLLFSRAAAAKGRKRNQLVDALIAFGLKSIAAAVFREIVARATSVHEMAEPSSEATPDIFGSFRPGTRARASTQESAFEGRAESDTAAEEEDFEGEAEGLEPTGWANFEAGAAVGGAAGGGGGWVGGPKKAMRPSTQKKAHRPIPKAKVRRVKKPRRGLKKAKVLRSKKGGGGGGRLRAIAAPRLRNGAPRRHTLQRVEPAEQPRRPRFVNMNFARNGQPVAGKKPLVAKQKYALRVSIGERENKSVVDKSAPGVPDDLLPKRVDGHWLQVAAVSNHFRVAPVPCWMFLPLTGPAWACRCKPGSKHKCKPSSRRSEIGFPVTAPAEIGRASLRLTVYFQKSILQSLQMTATIASTASAKGSSRAIVDYNLTRSLTDVDLVRPRALSVMMNDADDGSHTIVFNGAPKEVAAVHLTNDQMNAAVKVMRTVMRNIHIKENGTEKVNRFNNSNEKSLDDFIVDLREAAARGYELWNTLWYDKLKQWKKNRPVFAEQSDVIHIGRKEQSPSVFPWAMVYDFPIDIGAPANNHLCDLLTKGNWDKFHNSAEVPARCPYENTHGMNVICPFGFWGFRYEIELPPSLPAGRSLPRSIPVTPPPLNFVVALSNDLNPTLLTAHLKVLKAQSGTLVFRPCQTRDEIRDGLGLSAIEVVYFYCHGFDTPLPGDAGTRTTLGVGTNELIEVSDLALWFAGWTDDHWATISPLIFINGCHTADTTPQTLVNFVDAFSASLEASGVIGTEITVHQLVANEAGETFLKQFQKGQNVGAAMREMRGRLLKKGNLLGLVYTAYCSADLQFAAGIA